jgi:hypothetical protein
MKYLKISNKSKCTIADPLGLRDFHMCLAMIQEQAALLSKLKDDVHYSACEDLTFVPEEMEEAVIILNQYGNTLYHRFQAHRIANEKTPA